MKDKVEGKSRNSAAVFRSFDRDKSGSVDVDEFRSGLSSLGVFLQPAEFTKLMQMVDADGRGLG